MSSITLDTLQIELTSNSTGASKGLDALSKSLGKLKNSSKGIGSIGKSFTDIAAKIGVAYLAVKKIGKSIGSAITEINSYIENVNLFNVSMGQFAVEAKEYAETVGEIMGIDPGEWMRNQGIFMTLATGFGTASDRAYTMSKNLTQLGYDLSSFYNIDTGDAMQKLQSGLSGELEPLRRLGYDLSQAKLQAVALELGISKAVSAMTQAEKAELRYYAIMTQVTQVQGDMSRTLDQPANQLRILKAQFTQLTRAIGSLFIPILNKVVPYLIAATKVLREMVSAIASFFGFTMPEVDYSSVTNGANGATDALDEATESAKKLKDYTMGFDELNVINPSTGADEGALDGSGFDFELPEYDFIGDATGEKINAIVEKMKEWLGITGNITSWGDLFNTKLGTILTTVGAVGLAFGAWKLGEGILSVVKGVSSALPLLKGGFTGVGTILGGLSAPVIAVIGAITALVAGLAAVYATNEDVRTSVNQAVKDIGLSFVPLFTYISDTVVPNLKSAWDGIILILTPFGEWLSMAFTSIWEDMLIPILQLLGEKVIPDLIGIFKNLWEKILVPLGQFVGDILGPVFAILSDVLTWLWQGVVAPLADFIIGVFSSAWDAVVAIINNFVIPVVNILIDGFMYLWNSVLAPIITFLWDTLKPVFDAVFTSIGEIIGDLKLVFTGLLDFITGIFSGDWEKAWQGIVDLFTGIWEGLKDIVRGIINPILALIESFINKIIDGWNWLKEQINSLSFEVPDWVPGIGGDTVGFDLAMSSHVSLPRLADGGFVDEGQLFIAREAGAEMVGSIGRRTAVANNDQIVSGIAHGVAEANGEQNALLREQNALLRQMLEKESGVYLDGRKITNAVEKHQRDRGRVLITGGAY